VGDPRELERYGLRVEAPPGWHVRMTRATVEAATRPLGTLTTHPQLGPDDLSVRLFEQEPDLDYFPLSELEHTHSPGPPRAFTVGEFGQPDAQWAGDGPQNHSYVRRNFRVSGRFFDLFVEAGGQEPSATAVDQLNELIASLRVREGDFYPGSVQPPTFPSEPGWHVGSADGGEVRATDYAEAWAATVPYLNGPRDLPPARTLETLPPDGVLIWVGIGRDNRFPPTSEIRRGQPEIRLPLRLDDMKGGPGWEGQIRDISLYRLHGLVPDRYHVDVWVFFGRAEPSPEQRARAKQVLGSLVMPDWGPWELDGRGVVAAPGSA
jgi:hypothetical protein